MTRAVDRSGKIASERTASMASASSDIDLVVSEAHDEIKRAVLDAWAEGERLGYVHGYDWGFRVGQMYAETGKPVAECMAALRRMEREGDGESNDA